MQNNIPWRFFRYTCPFLHQSLFFPQPKSFTISLTPHASDCRAQTWVSLRIQKRKSLIFFCFIGRDFSRKRKEKQKIEQGVCQPRASGFGLRVVQSSETLYNMMMIYKTNNQRGKKGEGVLTYSTYSLLPHSFTLLLAHSLTRSSTESFIHSTLIVKKIEKKRKKNGRSLRAFTTWKSHISLQQAL